MEFKLTSHAQKRCLRRKIQHKWIKNALEHPLRIKGDPDDNSLVHVFWPVPDKGYRVLRVIYNETVSPVAIVTAYFENEVINP